MSASFPVQVGYRDVYLRTKHIHVGWYIFTSEYVSYLVLIHAELNTPEGLEPVGTVS